MLGLAMILHLALVGRPVPGEETNDVLFHATLSSANGAWWQVWRLALLGLGLVLLGVSLAFRLAARSRPGLGRLSPWIGLGGALVVGAVVISVEIPDELRMGFSFTTFELPLRLMLSLLSAAAIWLALGPVSSAWSRRSSGVLVVALAGVIGVLAIPQPSAPYTPYQLALLCDGRPRAALSRYPECVGPLEIQAQAVASPIGVFPEAWVLQRRTLGRLEGRLAHLDRLERLASEQSGAGAGAGAGTGAVPASVREDGAWTSERAAMSAPDPRLRAEARNAALHLHFTHFRWACLGLVTLLGLALALPLLLSASFRRGAVARSLLLGLGGAALLAATPLLPQTTFTSPLEHLPTFLLGPLSLLAVLALAREIQHGRRLTRGDASVPAAGVVGVSHGAVETPAGPWKVMPAGTSGAGRA
jgi:hypothetical protein